MNDSELFDRAILRIINTAYLRIELIWSRTLQKHAEAKSISNASGSGSGSGLGAKETEAPRARAPAAAEQIM
jgi:hypothetical protein